MIYFIFNNILERFARSLQSTLLYTRSATIYEICSYCPTNDFVKCDEAKVKPFDTIKRIGTFVGKSLTDKNTDKLIEFIIPESMRKNCFAIDYIL